MCSTNITLTITMVPIALIVAVLPSCGGLPPRATALPVPTAADSRAKNKEPMRAERPITPATLMLVTDFLLAPPMNGQYSQERAFPLADGGSGFLNAAGERSVATLAEVRPIKGPTALRDLCVAADGKVTFAASKGASHLWRAESFEGLPKNIGTILTELGRTRRPERRSWVASDEKEGTLLVSCASGKAERLGPPSSSATELHWSDAVQILRLQSSKPESRTCMIRTQKNTVWSRHPDCYPRTREDGSLSIEAVPQGQARAQTKKRAPEPRCLFVLDDVGMRHPCTMAPDPAVARPPKRAEEETSVAAARHYAPSRAVVPGPEGALFALTERGELANRIGPPSLRTCAPLLPTAPLFRCATADGRGNVVINVSSEGRASQELLRPQAQSTDEGGALSLFHVTSDGGVAVGGDCDGNVGEIACVRTAKGKWHGVQFSKELTAALNRTAPATRLVPTTDGRLYVGTGTMDGLLGGDARVLIFRADHGPGVPVEKIPAWILGSLSGLGELGALLGRYGQSGAALLSWSTSRSVRVWPLERLHPAFQTKESCRVDIGLDGSFDTVCVQGRLHAVGRFGLLQKRPGELFETLDAGESWARIPLPKGLNSEDIQCTALGCRIGPYWRMGWGSR